MGLESGVRQELQALPVMGDGLFEPALPLGLLPPAPHLFCVPDRLVVLLPGGKPLFDLLAIAGDLPVVRLEGFRLVGRCERLFQFVGGRHGPALCRLLHDRQQTLQFARLRLRLGLHRFVPGRLRILLAPKLPGHGKTAGQVRNGAVVIMRRKLGLTRGKKTARLILFRLSVAGLFLEAGQLRLLAAVELCRPADFAGQDKGLPELFLLDRLGDGRQLRAGFAPCLLPLAGQLLLRGQQGRVLGAAALERFQFPLRLVVFGTIDILVDRGDFFIRIALFLLEPGEQLLRPVMFRVCLERLFREADRLVVLPLALQGLGLRKLLLQFLLLVLRLRDLALGDGDADRARAAPQLDAVSVFDGHLCLVASRLAAVDGGFLAHLAAYGASAGGDGPLVAQGLLFRLRGHLRPHGHHLENGDLALHVHEPDPFLPDLRGGTHLPGPRHGHGKGLGLVLLQQGGADELPVEGHLRPDEQLYGLGVLRHEADDAGVLLVLHAARRLGPRPLVVQQLRLDVRRLRRERRPHFLADPPLALLRVEGPLELGRHDGHDLLGRFAHGAVHAPAAVLLDLGPDLDFAARRHAVKEHGGGPFARGRVEGDARVGLPDHPVAGDLHARDGIAGAPAVLRLREMDTVARLARLLLRIVPTGAILHSRCAVRLGIPLFPRDPLGDLLVAGGRETGKGLLVHPLRLGSDFFCMPGRGAIAVALGHGRRGCRGLDVLEDSRQRKRCPVDDLVLEAVDGGLETLHLDLDRGLPLRPGGIADLHGEGLPAGVAGGEGDLASGARVIARPDVGIVGLSARDGGGDVRKLAGLEFLLLGAQRHLQLRGLRRGLSRSPAGARVGPGQDDGARDRVGQPEFLLRLLDGGQVALPVAQAGILLIALVRQGLGQLLDLLAQLALVFAVCGARIGEALDVPLVDVILETAGVPELSRMRLQDVGTGLRFAAGRIAARDRLGEFDLLAVDGPRHLPGAYGPAAGVDGGPALRIEPSEPIPDVPEGLAAERLVGAVGKLEVLLVARRRLGHELPDDAACHRFLEGVVALPVVFLERLEVGDVFLEPAVPGLGLLFRIAGGGLPLPVRDDRRRIGCLLLDVDALRLLAPAPLLVLHDNGHGDRDVPVPLSFHAKDVIGGALGALGPVVGQLPAVGIGRGKSGEVRRAVLVDRLPVGADLHRDLLLVGLRLGDGDCRLGIPRPAGIVVHVDPDRQGFARKPLGIRFEGVKGGLLEALDSLPRPRVAVTSLRGLLDTELHNVALGHGLRVILERYVQTRRGRNPDGDLPEALAVLFVRRDEGDPDVPARPALALEPDRVRMGPVGLDQRAVGGPLES